MLKSSYLSQGVGASGNIYLGCNMEFANVPLNFSVHAEQCLISSAFSQTLTSSEVVLISFISDAVRHGEQELAQLIVNWAPCGHCRQFLSELYNSVRGFLECLFVSMCFDIVPWPLRTSSLTSKIDD